MNKNAKVYLNDLNIKFGVRETVTVKLSEKIAASNIEYIRNVARFISYTCLGVGFVTHNGIRFRYFRAIIIQIHSIVLVEKNLALRVELKIARYS